MVLLYTILFAAAVSAKCYEADTAHPLPDLDANDVILQGAFASISTALTAAIAAREFVCKRIAMVAASYSAPTECVSP
jgi:hypothetical protein